MSILETVLIFAGIPVGIAVVVAGLVYAGSSSRRTKRYRPGRPFEFRPVWFLSAPEALGEVRPALAAGTPAELTPADSRPGRSVNGTEAPGSAVEGSAVEGSAVEGRPVKGGGGATDGGDDWPAPGPAGANGGASDRW